MPPACDLPYDCILEITRHLSPFCPSHARALLILSRLTRRSVDQQRAALFLDWLLLHFSEKAPHTAKRIAENGDAEPTIRHLGCLIRNLEIQESPSSVDSETTQNMLREHTSDAVGMILAVALELGFASFSTAGLESSIHRAVHTGLFPRYSSAIDPDRVVGTLIFNLEGVKNRDGTDRRQPPPGGRHLEMFNYLIDTAARFPRDSSFVWKSPVGKRFFQCGIEPGSDNFSHREALASYFVRVGRFRIYTVSKRIFP